MRIHGRILRPSDLSERRLLLGCLGVPFVRVPRSQNPYVLARRIRQAARLAAGVLGTRPTVALTPESRAA